MAELIQIMTPYGPTEAQHWYLTDREVMWQTLKELIDVHQHRGVVMEWPDVNGEQVWRLEANDYAGNSVAATFGQHLVMPTHDHLFVYDRTYFEAILIPEQGE